jgi:hypothetical protein
MFRYEAVVVLGEEAGKEVKLTTKMGAPEYEREAKATLKKDRSEVKIKLREVANWHPAISQWQI